MNGTSLRLWNGWGLRQYSAVDPDIILTLPVQEHSIFTLYVVFVSYDGTNYHMCKTWPLGLYQTLKSDLAVQYKC